MSTGFTYSIKALDRSAKAFDAMARRADEFGRRAARMLTAPFRALSSMKLFAFTQNVWTLAIFRQ